MDKKHLHHLWKRIRPVKTWYLLVAFLLCATVAVFALRHNYQVMVELRENVYQADREAGDVEGALQELRRHVNNHMNTNLTSGAESVYPPIQLKHTYERLVKARQERLKASNVDLYTAAQNHCEQQHPESFIGGPRVPCIEEYVREHGVGVNPDQEPIPDALYKFDFASPSWSPDLAGWSVLASAVLLVAAAVRFGLGRWIKH
jgi:hypothetical protein